MKQALRTLFYLLLFTWGIGQSSLYAQGCPFVDLAWVKMKRNPGRNDGRGVATDSQGNIVVTGNFRGTMNLDSSPLISNGGDDVYIAKFSPDGVLIWAFNFGSAGDDVGRGVAITEEDSIYVVGNFTNTLNFSSQGGPTTVVSTGSSDAFIVKLSPDGIPVWARAFGGTEEDIAYDVATQSDDSGVYLTGSFTNEILFDFPPNQTSKTSQGGVDFFIASFSSTGEYSGIETGGGPDTDEARGITVDPLKDIYITGKFSDTLRVGLTETTGEDAEAFIIKFNPGLGMEWVQTIQGEMDEYGFDIAADQTTFIYATGTTASSSVKFGNITLNNPAEGNEIFIAKIDDAGNFIWAELDGGSTEDGSYGIAVDNSGNVYVTGYFTGEATFGNSDTGGTLRLIQSGNPSIPVPDAFAIKYDPDKKLLWGISAGLEGSEEGYAIAVNSSTGDAYIVGNADSIQNRCAIHRTNGDGDAFLTKVQCTVDVMSVDAIVTKASPLPALDGSITVIASGGVPPYLYALTLNGEFGPQNQFTGLPAATYDIRVMGADSCISFIMVEVQVKGSCGVPEFINATPGKTSINLEWIEVSEANSYKIYYTNSQNGKIDSVTVNAPASTATLTGLDKNSVYEIQINATCESATSAKSDIIQLSTTDDCLKPDVTPIDVGETSARIMYTAGSTDFIKITPILPAGEPRVFDNTTSPFIISNLTPDTRYRVCMIPAECPTDSSCAEFQTPKGTSSQCGDPTDLEIDSVSASTLRISWTLVDNALSYEVSFKEKNESSFSSPIIVPNTQTDTKLTGLNAGTNYVIRVRAICNEGSSNYATIEAETSPCPRPSITAKASGKGIQVDWDDMDGVPLFQVEYKLESDGIYTVLGVFSNSNATIEGIQKNSTYLVRVRSLCSSSSASEYDEVVVEVPNCLGVFTNVTLLPEGTLISWQPVNGSVGYQIQYKSQNSRYWSALLTQTDTFKLFQGFIADTTYLFRVRNICVAKTEFSAFDTLVFKAPSCGKPTNLRVCGVSPALVTWSAIPGADLYLLSYRKESEPNWTYSRLTDTIVTIENERNETKYIARVQAICLGQIVSAFSNVDTSKNCPDLCKAPTNLAVDQLTLGTNEATVSWGSVTGARTYTVRYKKVGDLTWKQMSTTETFIRLTDLDPNTQYNFGVEALCVLNLKSGFSASSIFKTLSPSCPAPIDIVLKAVTQNSATLKWTAPPGVTTFEIRYKMTSSNLYTSMVINKDSIIIPNLNNNESYEFTVRSKCGSGIYSTYIQPNFIFTIQPPCAAPTEAIVQNITSTKAEIRWLPSQGAVKYRVKVRRKNTNTFTTYEVTETVLALDNLSKGTEYEAFVFGMCSDKDVSAKSDTVAFQTKSPCPAPTEISFTDITSAQAIVNWNEVPGAVGYRLEYRQVGSNDFILVDTLEFTSLQLDNLLEQTNYEVRVRTICTPNEDISTFVEDTFTTKRAGCSTPLNFNAKALTLHSIALSWDGSDGAQSYEIQYRPVGGNFITRTTTNTKDTLLELNSGVTYEILVRAVCGVNEFTPFTPVLKINTLTDAECQAPRTLVAISKTDTSIILAWTQVVGAIGYQIAYRVVGAPDWNTQVSLNIVGRRDTLLDLLPNTSYEVMIQTLCSNEGSFFTNPRIVKTNQAVVNTCPVPQNLTATPETNSATLRWGSVNGALKYLVSYRRFNTPTYTTTETTADTLRITNLISNTVYEFRVRTICGAGDTSAFSVTRAFPTLPTQPCNTPVFRSHSVASTKITVRWVAVNNALGYEVLYRKTSDADYTTVSVSGGSMDSLILANLERDTQYAFKIRTKCQNGNSAFTEETTVRTLTSDPCVAPSGVMVAPAMDSAVVSWDVVPGALGYVVAYRMIGGNGDWDTEVIMDPNARSFTIPGLIANTNYETMLQTLCELVPSEFSIPVQFKTLPVPPCGTPESLTFSGITKTRAIATWSPVTNATKYRVQWKRLGLGSFTSVIIQAPTTTFNFSNLTPGAVFIVRVIAMCPSGSGPAIERQFSTLSGKESFADIPEIQTYVYPNPNKGNFNVRIESQIAQKINIKIYSITGQVVYQEIHPTEIGENTLPIDLNNVTKGLYLLEIQNGELKRTVKLVIE